MSDGPAGELTTAQVAEHLGVKVQTVYAYVSRGVLAPVRRDPRIGSLFDVREVQSVAGGPGRSGRRRTGVAEDVRTAITEIGPGSLAYRGSDVRRLAGAATFEQVRDLLVGLPAPASDGGGEQLDRVMSALPPVTPVLDRFKHAVLVAAGTDPGRHDRSPAAFASAGARCAGVMAASVSGMPSRPAGDAGLAASLSAYLPGVPLDLLDMVLVLLADHDLATSTTAVRVAVSAGSDAYSCLLAGLAAADSPVHVAASLAVVDWLRAALRDPQQALDTALVRGRPPGFGHLVYTEQDPRAQLLLDRFEHGTGDPAPWAAVRHLEAELLERRDWVLTVDVALALLVLTHDLPRDAGVALFACARTAGWTAHAVEELAAPAMRFRLRGVYTGTR
ncbi:citrate synthase [Ornithinimicrobium sp. LYQ92]|uniref:citrate synthase n=1 Tax=Serinicoccus sp. LYQ92 TaxID=3378798 RepID=UPI003854EDD6